MLPRFLTSGLLQLPRGDILVVPQQLAALYGLDFSRYTVEEIRAAVNVLLADLGYGPKARVWFIDPESN